MGTALLVRDVIQPVIAAPPGITSNFDDPVSRGYVVVVTGTAFLTLALCFLVIRLYTRFFITSNVGADDCTLSRPHPCRISSG